MTKVLLAVLALTFVLSCAPPDTGDVKDTMKEVRARAKTIDRLAQRMNASLRQVAALAIRHEQLADLLAEDDMRAKVYHAGEYFRNMEFQYWTGVGDDTPSRRETLEAQGVLEFFQELFRFFKASLKKSLSAGDNDSRNLFALSEALGEINPFQLEVQTEIGVEPLSMKLIIEEALRNIQNSNVGWESNSQVVTIVSQNHGPAIALLQLRINVLLWSSISELAGSDPFPSDGLLTFLQHPLDSISSSYRNMSMEHSLKSDGRIDLETKTQFDLDEASAKAGEAVREEKFLHDIGQSVELDPDLKAVLTGVFLQERRDSNARRLNTIVRIQNALREFRP